MPIVIDPETRQRVVFSKHSGDVQYYANTFTTQSAVYNETVPVIGPWTDYTGSDGPNSQTQIQFAGVTNILQGGVAGIEGAKLPQLNEVGQRQETTRRRIRLIHREIENDKFK